MLWKIDLKWNVLFLAYCTKCFLVKYIYKNVGIANQMTGFYMERNTELKLVCILSVLSQKGES